MAVVLVLAACGASRPSASTTRTAATKTGTTTASSNGIAAETPRQILAAAEAALRSASGFVIAGTITQHGQAARLEILDEGRSKLQMRISQNGTTADIIVLSGAGYVRADTAFWNAHGAAAAAGLLANRWIEIPATAGRQLTSSVGSFAAPRTLARCLGEDVGTLSRDGTTTVDGSPAVVIRDAGNVPGGSPGTLAVATTGPAYPLRVTSTGPTRAGGKVDVCNTGEANDTQGSLTLSRFDHVPAITAPANPVRIGSASGSSI